MKIYLPHVPEVPDQFNYVDAFRRLIEIQRDPRRFTAVDDPSEADLILFTECHEIRSDWRLRAITHSEVARSYPDRIAVYDSRDRPWCSLPGIYVNMPRNAFNSRWQVAGSYWHSDDPAWRVDVEVSQERKYLFSFVGSPTHRCRKAIFALARERSFVERVDGFTFRDSSSYRFDERRKRFAEVLLESSFVLCPRGAGTSSFRLYEVLAAGRVPVIIADDWVPPQGPDWNSFAIRWPESQIEELPGELQRREGQATDMGLRARRAFETWFASDTAFTNEVDALVALLAHSPRREFPAGGIRDAQFYKVLGAELVRSPRRSLAKSHVAKSLYRAAIGRRRH